MSHFMNLIGVECSSVGQEENHLNPRKESRRLIDTERSKPRMADNQLASVMQVRNH